MTLSLLAKIGLALWMLLSIAAHLEGLKSRGSAGYKVLSFTAETTFVSALLWAAFWA